MLKLLHRAAGQLQVVDDLFESHPTALRLVALPLLRHQVGVSPGVVWERWTFPILSAGVKFGRLKPRARGQR